MNAVHHPPNGSGQLPPIDLWALAPSFEGLPESIIQSLAHAAGCRQYAAGEVLFLEGEPTAGLFLIETGAVKISRVSKDGREQILQIAPRGTTFNEVSVLDGGPNPATAIAHSDTVARYIVLSGSLIIFKQSHLLELGTIEPGEFIGEGAFINNRERSTSARAKVDTILLAITPEALTRLPNVIREKIKDRIIEGMSERIIKLSNFLESRG